MNHNFYFKMAGQSIRKNKKLYVPFIMAASGMIALYCIFSFLANHSGLNEVRGGDSVKQILNAGCRIMEVFSAVFLFYTNSFLMKQRKMELGLYCVLGMEKKHVAAILTWETLICGGISLGSGILFGILFSKAFYVILLRVIGDGVRLGFLVPWKAVAETILVFILLFLAILIYNSSCVRMIRPLELLQSGKKGEREPKTRWLRALISLLMLGSGYYLAIASGSPLTAIGTFFIAILLVMAGTYGLFESGVIALLKILQKKRSFYYKTRNFVSVSGLKYRMKRNGVSLANICILSTAVLITICTTVTIYNETGKRNTGILLEGDWKNDQQTREMKKKMKPVLEKYGVNVQEVFYGKLASVLCSHENSKFSAADREDDKILMTTALTNLLITDAKSHKEMTGEDFSLQEDELVVYTISGKELPEICYFDEQKFTIKERKKENPYPMTNGLELTDTYVCVVNDMSTVKTLSYLLNGEKADKKMAVYKSYIQIFTEDAARKEIPLAEELKQLVKEYDFSVESSEKMKQNYLALNGSLLFIGVFIGIIFLLATVMIIYYKQITEGYEDRERFQIMCKIGMSEKEVKESIRSQIQMVFFFPLVMAGMHVMAAVPCLTNILVLFHVLDKGNFLICSLATFLVFTLVYICVYGATARNYYSIVDTQS